MSKVETRSASWMIVKQYCEQRIAELRGQLESSLNFEETQMARARLRELKQLLELGEDPEAPLVEADYILPS